jgi:hypothetical protein
MVDRPRRVRGDKSIALELEAVWGFPVSEKSVARWRELDEDPLPHVKVLITGNRPIVASAPDELRAWAKRQIRDR